MESFLVEVYLARSRGHELPAIGCRMRAIADDLSLEGVAVRYVRTMFLPDDETCFHVFGAESLEAVATVCRRAELRRARIVAAVEAAQSQA